MCYICYLFINMWISFECIDIFASNKKHTVQNTSQNKIMHSFNYMSSPIITMYMVFIEVKFEN